MTRTISVLSSLYYNLMRANTPFLLELEGTYMFLSDFKEGRRSVQHFFL